MASSDVEAPRTPREAAPVLGELGFYALAGQPESSADLIGEVITGEAMGFGTAFISERYHRKEAVTLSGAAGAAWRRSRQTPRRRGATPTTWRCGPVWPPSATTLPRTAG